MVRPGVVAVPDRRVAIWRAAALIPPTDEVGQPARKAPGPQLYRHQRSRRRPPVQAAQRGPATACRPPLRPSALVPRTREWAVARRSRPGSLLATEHRLVRYHQVDGDRHAHIGGSTGDTSQASTITWPRERRRKEVSAVRLAGPRDPDTLATGNSAVTYVMVSGAGRIVTVRSTSAFAPVYNGLHIEPARDLSGRGGNPRVAHPVEPADFGTQFGIQPTPRHRPPGRPTREQSTSRATPTAHRTPTPPRYAASHRRVPSQNPDGGRRAPANLAAPTPPHWPPHDLVAPSAPRPRIHRHAASHPRPRSRGPDPQRPPTSPAPTANLLDQRRLIQIEHTFDTNSTL